MTEDVESKLADELAKGGPKPHFYTGGKGGILKATRISPNLEEMVNQVKAQYPEFEYDATLLRTALFYFCHVLLTDNPNAGFVTKTEELTNALLAEEQRKLTFQEQAARLGRFLSNYREADALEKGLELFRKFMDIVKEEKDSYWQKEFMRTITSQREVKEFLGECKKAGLIEQV